jgi:ribonuclease E
MADTPVDTVDTPATEATSPAEKPAPKKKAPAKKAPAKKATAKKAAPSAEKPADDKPAKKTAAKKTTAKRTAAKKTPAKKPAAAAAPDSDRGDLDESGAPTAAVLFQAPEKKPAAKKAKAKPETAPKDADQADDKGAAATVDEGGEGGAEDGDAEQGEGGTSTAARRRRRRGGRRRRKPAGAGGAGADSDDADADESDNGDAKADAEDGTEDGADASDETTDEGGEQAEGGGTSSSSRRRRRRRREGEGGSGSEGEPNTVTRVRKPRSPEDEITAVSGSTRLEAKKQRRREGREAGRRRAPIVSEAEFLARRESVERVMVVRQRKDLTQIAVLEDTVLVEHYVARESQTSLIGNVYLGRVQNVLPSMEAAFIDIGKGRNAVLYAGEVNWSALGHKEGQPRKIESVLTSGQTVLVQVTKDPIGHKGARLTSQVSLAGRFLVYVPDGTTSGISRKLPDTERGRLKSLLKEIVPDTAGVIVRTAAEGASEDELTRDVERLKARWEDIEKKVAKGNAPQLLYGEPDLTLKVVRDLFTEDFVKLVVQGEDAWDTVHGYVEQVAPDLSERLEHYQTSAEGESDKTKPDVFATYRIDEQIAKGLDRKVWLPSGGSLIIDRTEAMTVVDVNTGKFTGSGGNLEETVTKNNLEAAEEIVRQLRLRDIGGIIVVDFIDMVLESNRDLVLRRLVECLGRDRTRHQVAEVTTLGLVQMTRKRIGTGLLEAFSENCDHCQGRGIVVHDLPVEPRRGGGDDDSRRSGTRRRRGKGGGSQSDEPASKAVPSPKDVAAMAKPPAPDAEDAPTEVAAFDAPADDVSAAEMAADEVTTEDAVTEEAVTEDAVTEDAVTEDAASEDAATDDVTSDEVSTDGVVAEADAPVEVSVEPVEAAEPSEPAESQEPAEPAAPVEPAAPKVVTRTRRRAATRPAGPPVSTATAAPSVDGAPVVEETPASHEEPHVEHVPIKRKGTRKR